MCGGPSSSHHIYPSVHGNTHIQRSIADTWRWLSHSVALYAMWLSFYCGQKWPLICRTLVEPWYWSHACGVWIHYTQATMAIVRHGLALVRHEYSNWHLIVAWRFDWLRSVRERDKERSVNYECSFSVFTRIAKSVKYHMQWWVVQLK